MIRNVVTLTLNDLAIAFTNKTLLLIFFIPLFVFVSLKFVDQDGSRFQVIKIGLLQNATYPQNMIDGIQSTDQIFEIFWLADITAGESLLKDKKIDGMLVPSDKGPDNLDLVVLSKASFQTVAIVESITALQDAIVGKQYSWIAAIKALHDNGLQKQTLPTWILMLVLLVGFIILPVQVAEEKEKNLLLGLLQTPILEIDWLLAKVLLGIILMSLAVGFLQVLGRFGFDLASTTGYVTFLIFGGFCFSAFGIFLGFLCRSQASARTLGVLFYLPNLLPAALSDFSLKLTSVAPLFPSFHFYEPVRSILLEDGSLLDYRLDLVYLVIAGFVLLLLSWLLMKRRWLM